jgi:3-oxoacyl-[acyl-carrier-protein] synthase II
MAHVAYFAARCGQVQGVDVDAADPAAIDGVEDVEGQAAALGDVLGPAAGRIPTVAAKSHFGNLGAGSGLVECVASIMALERGSLFPVLNYASRDEDCPIRAARRGDAAGDSFVSVAATPQGQAGAVAFRRWPTGPAAA